MQIQALYREDNKLKGLEPEERLEHRRLTVCPLADTYFAWVKENQERYLRVFLEDREVPMDNDAAKQAIRGFCIGKKNWVMIDTVAGADASAIIYSLAETAKANNLKPYDYFEYLLTEIPKHMDDCDTSFCEELLP